MHIERVHFDEVFDVQAGRGDFSFRSGGKPVYGVQLRRNMIPRAGSTYLIAFRKPGDWSTVLGWRDLAAREVTLRHGPWTIWLVGLDDISTLAQVAIAGGFLAASIAGGIVAAAATVGLCLFQAVHALRLNREAQRLLSADAGRGQRGSYGVA